MVTYTMDEVRAQLGGLVERASHGERILVACGDEKVAALVPFEDAEFMQEREDRLDLEAVRAAREEPGESISLEEFEAELQRDR